MNTLLPAILAASLAAPAATFAQSKDGKSRTRQVFVRVTDAQGAPVADLRPVDFNVTEGGVTRTVARAALGTSPMRIVLVADTSDGAAAALNHLRAGLLAFLDAVPSEHEVMLVSTGRQTRVRVAPTTDRKKLKDSAAGLFTDGGATVLVDTLLEMDDRFLKKSPDRWPVFVIVTGDGAEGSAGANEKKFNEWIAAMPARGISAHAIALKYKGGGNPEIIANHVAHTGGGVYDFMNTSNALPEKLKALGDRVAADAQAMSSWYELDFETDAPDTAPVDIGVARSGVRLRISHRRGAQ